MHIAVVLATGGVLVRRRHGTRDLPLQAGPEHVAVEATCTGHTSRGIHRPRVEAAEGVGQFLRPTVTEAPGHSPGSPGVKREISTGGYTTRDPRPK